jgi:hypothetical protein
VLLLDAVEEQLRKGRRLRVTRQVSTVAAILSLGLFNTFWYLSDKAYNDYIDSGANDESLKRQITLYDSLTVASGVAAVAGTGLAIGILIVEQRRGVDR